MSEFKPMVKMYTDEPSISLKLKKGGKVKGKHHEHGEHGHKHMEHMHGSMHSAHHAFDSEHGKAPKKPSMSERRKSMNPMQYAKGGKVAHKLDGGMMPGAAAPMAPMGRAALGQMAPAARMARAAMVRKALTGMKKGGAAEAHCKKLEKELHHHEMMKDSAHGGKAHAKHGGHMHHKADGGAIDRDETKTTVKGNVAKFAKTKMVDGDHKDKAHGTGEVHEGKPGGYKHGGKVHHVSGHPVGSHEHHKHMAKHHAKKHAEGGSHHHKKMAEHHKHEAKMCKGGSYAVGGAVPSETNEKVNKGHMKFKETIEGNEHDFDNTEMHTAKPDHAHGTGGVKMGNGGGYKHGGKTHKMHHKADGGAIDKYETRTTVEGGNWENRPANTSKPGKSNTHTGEVKEANAGGYKHGGHHHSKKQYATGGNVVDDGKPTHSPRKPTSRPVANSLQSGTFKKGGRAKKFDGGGSTGTDTPPPDVMDQYQTMKENQGYANYQKNKATEKSQPGFLESLYNKFTGNSAPAGSVTKTTKSVTVTPKKRGGRTK